MNISAAAVFLFFLAGLFPQEQQPFREKLEVINIEVPVRVFDRGRPVEQLTKKDFVLLEDGDPQAIHGFTIRKKRIAIQNVLLQTAREASPVPSRYFVLVFRILEYNGQLQEGVKYIFENIVKENDQLMVFVNDRTIFLNQDVWQVERRQILDKVLSEEATKARQRLESYFLRVKKDLDQTKLQMLIEDQLNFNPVHIVSFLERYLETWKEYKKKYLIPDLDGYYNFSRHLETIKKEKWVLTFYQIEMFPRMKITGQIRMEIEDVINYLMTARAEDTVHAKIMTKLLETIDREFNVAADFPSEDISKLLLKVDTTYHSIIMGVEREALSEDLEYRRVSTDIENSLRAVAERSGGEALFSNDILRALHTIEEKQDLYYVLTYVPKNPDRKGKIKVLVKNRNYQVLYDDNIRQDYIKTYLEKRNAENPSIQLKGISFVNDRLVMGIGDYLMADDSKDRRAEIAIAVRVLDSQNQELFNQSRRLAVRQPQTTISVLFDWLEKGRYVFVIEARDLKTDKTAIDFLVAEIK